MSTYVSQISSEPGTDMFWNPWLVVSVANSGKLHDTEQALVRDALEKLDTPERDPDDEFIQRAAAVVRDAVWPNVATRPLDASVTATLASYAFLR